MFDINFIQEIIKDILSTGAYTLPGMAIYTNTPEEVLHDILTGINNYPTFELSIRLFELHITARQPLYKKIINKILSTYFSKEFTDV